MTFNTEKSGNHNSRPKGALNKQTRIAKLLDSHAEDIMKKVVEMALDGDSNTMRLCVERLMPKARQEITDIELPSKLDVSNINKLHKQILRAAIDGQISPQSAEKLIHLIRNEHDSKKLLDSLMNRMKNVDAIEASKIYQKIMIQ